MTLTDYIISIVGSSITVILELLSYKKLSNNKNKIISFKNLLIFVIYGIIITINIYFSTALNRAFINFALLFICTFIIYRDSISKILFYTLVIFIVGMIYEIILSIILSVAGINLTIFDTNLLIKSAFSFVNLILVYITFCINSIIKIFRKIEGKINKKIILIVFITCLVIIILTDFRYIITVSSKLYYLNIVIIVCLILLIIFAIYNYLRVEKEIEKTESILSFMTKYEETIDKDRINRHEMLNNLLMLKTIEDKNSIEYEKILNDLIKEYDKSRSIKNIYKLPTGLKGIVYYKLNNMDDINLNVNISKRIIDISKKINRKDYVSLCKILGIILDNAIEAAIKSKDKFIGIEVFNNKNEYTIIVDNSCNDAVDISKIKNKNYSTKGKGRGLGLYILNKIINNNNCISLIQSFNNMIFTSIIKVKIK